MILIHGRPLSADSWDEVAMSLANAGYQTIAYDRRMLQTENNPHGVPKATFDQMLKAMTSDRAAFFSSFFKDFFGVGMLSNPVSNELIEWTRAVGMQASLKATVDCATAFAFTDFRSDLKSIQVPTLIIHGTADNTVPIDATARVSASAISKSTLIEYERAARGLFATHRERLTKDLLAFLKQ